MLVQRFVRLRQQLAPLVIANRFNVNASLGCKAAYRQLGTYICT